MNETLEEVVEEFQDDSEAVYSHRPLLYRALEATDGAVIELGIGYGSTPLLHAYCAAKKRHLFSYETDPRWLQLLAALSAPGTHDFFLVNGWDDLYNRLPEGRFGVVFVDHAPAERRREEIVRLRGRADILVVHDTEARNEHIYQFREIFTSFPYRVVTEAFWGETETACDIQTTAVSDTLPLEKI